MKICSRCNEDKPEELFYKKRGYKDGLSSCCKVCEKTYSAKRYLDKKEHVAAVNAEWVRKNRDKKAAINRACHERNREKRREQDARSKKNNKGRVNSQNAFRRARRIEATPKWLTPEQKDDIKKLYKLSQKFERVFGVKYHIDHIVPLNGENVCGLHVPWNLQILESKMNIKKSNKADAFR